jgi:peroxiredoxin
LKAKGVDDMVCLAVNDPFVMSAWARSADATGTITMLADGNGDFTRALGLTMDAKGAAMGERGQRFALIAKDGKVTDLFIEEPKQFNVSSADNVLAHL